MNKKHKTSLIVRKAYKNRCLSQLAQKDQVIKAIKCRLYGFSSLDAQNTKLYVHTSLVQMVTDSIRIIHNHQFKRSAGISIAQGITEYLNNGGALPFNEICILEGGNLDKDHYIFKDGSKLNTT
jgi:hypothetical protein